MNCIKYDTKVDNFYGLNAKSFFKVCGIVGYKFFSKAPLRSDEQRMLEALNVQEHRGPDATSTTVMGKVILGHNRLAIIDLNPRSNQPFKDGSGRYAIIFNGEIYNYQLLKNNLLKKGYTFNTSSDTEVLLYHLIEYGKEGIDELNGCFAFAFYDSEEDEMVLARDHMGINPLLFSIQEDGIMFASELSALITLGAPFELNLEALSTYFKYTYIPAPYTILSSVQKLLPGHYIAIKGKHYDVVRYWSPEATEKFSGTYNEAKETCRSLVTDAVVNRLVADVPVGTFLSGGIDSSIVSAIASDFKSDLNTFSIGFKDAGFFDESFYANKVAERIGSRHHAISLADNEVQKELNHVLESFDEPFGDSSAIAMYFLSKYAKQHLTVCLSGDGADELLAGYNKHQAYMLKQKNPILLKLLSRIALKSKKTGRGDKLSNKIRQLKKFGILTKLKWPMDYWYLASFVSDESRKNLLKNSQLLPMPSRYDDENTLQNFLLKDQTFVLPNDMLKKVDVMSMAHSLEVRTPFLDKHVVRFVNSLPDEMKVAGGKGKVLLRDVFAAMLPAEIFNRPKQGFEVPLEKWIKSAWNELVDNKWFKEDYIEKQGLFHFKGVVALKEQLFSKFPEESATQMWLYIVFQFWYDKWKEKR